MNTPRNTLKSPQSLDLFEVGLEMARAHKEALKRQESVLEGLARVGKPTFDDWQEAAELDEYFRNMDSVPTPDELAEQRTEGRL